MSTGKKVLNVFGIIFAWILSIILVVNLIVAPIIMSTLSLLTPKKLTDLALDTGAITEFIKGSINNPNGEEVEELLSTNFAKQTLELYLSDAVSAFGGNKGEGKLTAEVLQNLANENMDELIIFAREYGAYGKEYSDEEVKQDVENRMLSKAEEMLKIFPDPQEIIERESRRNTDTYVIMSIIGSTTKIKISVIVSLIIVAALIFVCRLGGFKGVRWLSVDLFVASGVLALVCAGLGFGLGAIEQLIPMEAARAFEGLLTTFKTGVFVRSAVVLVAAVALIVAYVFIKKALAKKAAAVVSENVVLPEELVVDNEENTAVDTTNETL